ncbi:hypothetical protein D9M68_994360 [compost metagenome]
MPAFTPVFAAGLIARVFLLFPAGFNNQLSVFAVGIVFLIPLGFVVPFEALFKVPYGRIQRIELFAPYQAVVLGGGSQAGEKK